jgi:O-antigen/teichoic acid export membrane protein
MFVSRLGSSILGFVATVYFARTLGSEVLGIYFLAGAIAAWVKLGTNVGVPYAVTKRVSEQQGKQEHVIAGFLLISTALVIASGLLYVFRDYINQYLGAPLYYLVILLIIAEVLYGYVGAVIQGEELVHVEGLLRLAQTASRAVFQLLLVYVGFEVAGLLLGEIAAYVLISGVGAGLLVTYFGRSIPVAYPSRTHFESIVDFAKYSILGRVQGRAYNLMDTIVLGLFVPSGLVGIYGICWNISAVLEIFSKSIKNSLFPQMSKLSSSGDHQKVANRLNDALAFSGLLTIPGLVGAVIVGEGLLNLYGAEFRKGYLVLVLLVGSSLFHSYQTQFVNTMDALDRPDLSFKVNVFFVSTNMLMNVVLIYLYGWIGAAVATLASVILAMIVAYRFLTNILSFTIPFNIILNQIAGSLAMGGVLYAFVLLLERSGMNTHRVVPVVSILTLGVLAYVSSIMMISPRLRRVIIENLPARVEACFSEP